MKNRFITLCLLAMIFLTGCESSKAAYARAEISTQNTLEKMGFIVVENLTVPDSPYSCYLVHDKETNVMYYLALTYNGGVTLSPRYNENGDIMIYEGE